MNPRPGLGPELRDIEGARVIFLQTLIVLERERRKSEVKAVISGVATESFVAVATYILELEILASLSIILVGAIVSVLVARWVSRKGGINGNSLAIDYRK